MDAMTLNPSASLLRMKGEQAEKMNRDISRMNSLRGGRKVSEQQIDETAKEFEAVFISQMLEHMFAGVKTNEMFGGGEGEEMYKSLLVDEYGKLMARAGGIGLADHVKQEMLTLQEVE